MPSLSDTSAEIRVTTVSDNSGIQSAQSALTSLTESAKSQAAELDALNAQIGESYKSTYGALPAMSNEMASSFQRGEQAMSASASTIASESEKVVSSEEKVSSGTDKMASSWEGFMGLFSGQAILGSLSKAVSDVVSSFTQMENSQSSIGAVLKSTGGAAGVTAGQTEQLATSLSHVTAFSDDATLSAEKVLVTFSNISSDIFPKTVQATQDLSTVMGVSLDQAALQVGKAMNDPIKGVQTLQREGVQLTNSQLDLVKQLVDTGQGAKAQTLILNELEREFGGAAQAAGQTFGGQLNILQNSIDNTKQNIGSLIGDAITPLVSKVTEFIGNNQNMVISFAVAAAAAAALTGSLLVVAGTIAIIGVEMLPVIGLFVLLGAVVGGVVFEGMQKVMSSMKQTGSALNDLGGTLRASPQNFSEAQSGAASLGNQLQKLDEQVTQSNETYTQQLADMVSKTEQSVSDIKGQIDSENQAYADKVSGIKDSLDTQNQTYQQAESDRLAVYQDAVKTEKDKGVFASKDTLDRLADQYQKTDNAAKAANDKAVASLNKQLSDADTAHQKALDSLQDNLDKQTKLLSDHAAEVASVQGISQRDEIQKLEDTHAKELKGYAEQKESILSSAAAVKSGYTDQMNQLGANTVTAANNATKSLNGIFSGVNPTSGNATGTVLGANMGSAVTAAFKEAFSWDNIKKYLEEGFTAWIKWLLNAFQGAISGMENLFESMWTNEITWLGNKLGDIGSSVSSGAQGAFTNAMHALHIPGFASGVSNFSGGLARINEQGGEIVNLPNGSSVIPADKSAQIMSNMGTTINVYQTNTNYGNADMDAAARNLGFQLSLKMS